MISIVVPVYNGGETLPRFLDRLKTSIAGIEGGWELIFIDDGSTDDSLKIIKDICGRENSVGWISFVSNAGQQHAVLCGLRHSRGDYVITIDDDLEHPPEVVPELCGKASAGWDAVFALPSGVAKTGGVFRDLFFTLFLGKPRGLRISSYRILSRKAVDVISAARGRSVYISAELFRRGFAAACLFYDKTGGITTRSRYGGAARIRLYLKLFRNYAPLIRRLGTAPSTAGQYEIASSGGIL